MGQRVGFARACANEKRRSFIKCVAATFDSAALFSVELGEIGCGHRQPPRPRKPRPSLSKGLSPQLISRVLPRLANHGTKHERAGLSTCKLTGTLE